MEVPDSSSRRDIVVIGASAGGVNALLALCGLLPADFPAAVLIVLHVGQNPSVLPALLASRGHNRAVHAVDGLRLETGTLYIAPPDEHMLIEDGRVRLRRTAKEHHTRPSIDPLFRSAALAYGPRVIGVVLTGRLDDGTAGLRAVKDCGGLAVVQDPADAEYPDMPRSALESVATDRCVPLSEIAPTLVELLDQPLIETISIARQSPSPVDASPLRPAAAPRQRLEREMAVINGEERPVENLNAIGRPSPFACPDCSGVLWEIGDLEPARFRCHTGHAFSLRSFIETQRVATEDAIWAAVRALQSREEAMRRLAAVNRHVADTAQADKDELSADDAAAHAQLLLRMLQKDEPF